jgi:hypothetical protein
MNKGHRPAGDQRESRIDFWGEGRVLGAKVV